MRWGCCLLTLCFAPAVGSDAVPVGVSLQLGWPPGLLWVLWEGALNLGIRDVVRRWPAQILVTEAGCAALCSGGPLHPAALGVAS